jgi:hypothetical protein
MAGTDGLWDFGTYRIGQSRKAQKDEMILDLIGSVGSALQFTAVPVGKGKDAKAAARHGVVLLPDALAIIVAKRSHLVS